MTAHHAITPPPGPLREAHGHLGHYGLALSLPSLSSCTSVSECLEACAKAVKSASPGQWARLSSARVEGWTEGRWPTLAELDSATGSTPCVILSFDYHFAVANSAAMAAAGLAPGVTVPPNGVVVVDEKTGAATGLLREQAAYKAWNSAPEPTPAQLRTNIIAALQALKAMGFVEVHDLHSQPWLGDLLRTLEREGQLDLSVWLYPPIAAVAEVAARRAAFESPRIKLAGAKIFADGTLNGRTAMMIHRYSLPLAEHPRGQCMVPPAQLDEHIRLADSLNLPIAVHAIGDAAVRMVLDSIERVKPATPGHRIEHAEIIDSMDIPRFKALGVTCSVQPCHLLTDIEALDRYLPHRLSRVLPLRDLLESGLKPGVVGTAEAGLVFGSDVPIVRANPEDSIQAAVYRARPGSHHQIAPAQSITQAQAWSCFAV